MLAHTIRAAHFLLRSTVFHFVLIWKAVPARCQSHKNFPLNVPVRDKLVENDESLGYCRLNHRLRSEPDLLPRYLLLLRLTSNCTLRTSPRAVSKCSVVAVAAIIKIKFSYIFISSRVLNQYTAQNEISSYS